MERPFDYSLNYYQGDNDLQQALWESGNILENNFDESMRLGDLIPTAEWYDDEGRYCHLTHEITENRHFLRNSIDNNYANTQYFFTRIDPNANTKFTYILASHIKRVQQQDHTGRVLGFGERIPEAALLKSILDSYKSYAYVTFLQTYGVNGENEVDIFNEIAHNFIHDTRLSRIRRKLTEIVGRY